MSDLSSGFLLPSRDAQETPGPPWQAPALEQTNEDSSKASIALAILSEKIRSGALQRSELMQRIVVQGAAATEARGVALALRVKTDGAVVCCAATGDMAPPAGTVLDERSGFTAECLRNGAVMVCADSETDARVDHAACARLGVRSIVAAPVENEGSTIGVLEALSDQPAAFSKQHIEVLLTLACFAKSAVTPIVSQMQPSVQTVTATSAPAADPEAIIEPDMLRDPDLLEKIEDHRLWSERVPRRVRLAIVGGAAAALLLAILATAVFMWMWRQNPGAASAKVPNNKPKALVAAKPSAGIGTLLPQPAPRGHKTDRNEQSPALVSKASKIDKIPDERPGAQPTPETPVTSEEEIVAPAAITAGTSTDTSELSSVLSSPERLPLPTLPTSQGVTPARLDYRVEPVYPAEAKRLRIEGPVVLRAAIDEEGKVKSIGLVKGSPMLAQAAITAVRKWRYQPSQLNHRPAASTTDITIVFHLQ